MQKISIGLVSVWLTLSSLGGSASAEDKTREEALRARATAYWDAWRINDLFTIYHMETGTVEGTYTPDLMRQAFVSPLRLVNYKLTDIKVEGNSAQMVVEMTLTRPDFQGETFESPRKSEAWTFTQGNWYHGKSTVAAKEAAPDKAAPVPDTPGQKEPANTEGQK